MSPRSRANLEAAPVALRNWGVNDAGGVRELAGGHAAPVALRNWGVNGGAARLGITHGALSLWLNSRRQIPA